jgi:hypothetical protein
MSNVRSSMFPLAFASVLAAGAAFGGCVGKDDVDAEGSAGTASGGSPAVTAGNSSGGGVTAGTSASSAGTGGSTTALPAACATVAKPSGASPLITDFETMTTATGTYMFDAGAFTGGTYAYSDLMSTPVSTSALSLVEGHDASSKKALLVKISNNTWGGGMGLWFTCQDASAYTGVKFWARGVSPAGPVRFNLTVNETLEVKDNGPCAGPCTRPNLTFELTDEWTEHTFAWADFMPGDAAGTPVPPTADTLYGLDFGLTNDNMERELELAVDDFAFTTE